MVRYEHNTNLVIVNASDRAQGVMPYIFMEDGTLVALNIKGRRNFHHGIRVYWMTADQSYTVAQLQLKVQELIAHLNRQKDLTFKYLHASALTLINKQQNLQHG